MCVRSRIRVCVCLCVCGHACVCVYSFLCVRACVCLPFIARWWDFSAWPSIPYVNRLIFVSLIFSILLRLETAPACLTLGFQAFVDFSSSLPCLPFSLLSHPRKTFQALLLISVLALVWWGPAPFEVTFRSPRKMFAPTYSTSTIHSCFYSSFIFL